MQSRGYNYNGSLREKYFKYILFRIQPRMLAHKDERSLDYKKKDRLCVCICKKIYAHYMQNGNVSIFSVSVTHDKCCSTHCNSPYTDHTKGYIKTDKCFLNVLAGFVDLCPTADLTKLTNMEMCFSNDVYLRRGNRNHPLLQVVLITF